MREGGIYVSMKEFKKVVYLYVQQGEIRKGITILRLEDSLTNKEIFKLLLIKYPKAKELITEGAA